MQHQFILWKIAFFLFWMILNGRWTQETALIGAAVSGAALLFACKACDWSLRKEMGLYRAAPRIVAYCFTVIWEIVKANLNMCQIVYWGEADAVVSDKDRRHPTLKDMPAEHLPTYSGLAIAAGMAPSASEAP